jgi:hypothetical protein
MATGEVSSPMSLNSMTLHLPGTVTAVNLKTTWSALLVG